MVWKVLVTSTSSPASPESANSPLRHRGHRHNRTSRNSRHALSFNDDVATTQPILTKKLISHSSRVNVGNGNGDISMGPPEP
jgi:hypothetical protein